MDDLFRFMLVRAPRMVPEGEVDLVRPSPAFDPNAGPLDLVLIQVVRNLPPRLFRGDTAQLIANALPAPDLGGQLEKDSDALGDALIRCKRAAVPLPDVDGADPLDLRSRYDVLLRALAAPEPTAVIRPRPIALADGVITMALAVADDALGPPALAPMANPAAPADALADEIGQVESALTDLATLDPGDLALPIQQLKVNDDPPPIPQPTDLMLSSALLQRLPDEVDEDVEAVRLTTGSVPLTGLFERLVSRHRELVLAAAHQAAARRDAALAVAPGPPDLAGGLAAAADDGSVRPHPVGVADLLIVRRHVTRYEGGDVAHIENVLTGEKRERHTRRLERTEEFTSFETERTTENERDTQTTDRFALNRETNETLRQDTSFQAGLNVTARYGTAVEVSSNLDFQTQSSAERTQRVATEYSRDVVDRSVQRLTERVRELRSTLRIEEFEDRNLHSFDNQKAGAKNISGVYQWVNRVECAQVVNYGRRMMFRVVLNDPAALYIQANTANAAPRHFDDPGEFHLKPSDVTEWNYHDLGARYAATGLEPPPALVSAVSKAITDVKQEASGGAVGKAETVPIPPGYRAVEALWYRAVASPFNALFPVVGQVQPYVGINVAGSFVSMFAQSSGTVSGLYPIEGDLPVVVTATPVTALAVTIKVIVHRTAQGRAAWQNKVHAALYQAYLARRAEYDRAVADQLAGATQIRGRNPLRNEELVRVELRRSAIAALLGANLTGGPTATPATPGGYPEIDVLQFARQNAPRIHFFERSFEWEQMTFTFLPYYWAEKAGWRNRLMLDDVDDLFAQFLRAGAVEVAFPARPNFELGVLHYLETGQLWASGDPPPLVGEKYLPMLEELRTAEKFPTEGIPVGEPWDLRVPTTLVKLRRDDALPIWTRANGVWVERPAALADDDAGAVAGAPDPVDDH